MAESMREALAKEEFEGYKGIIIAGRAHVSYGLGIPFRYAQSSPETGIVTIVPRHLPEPEEKRGRGRSHDESHGWRQQ